MAERVLGSRGWPRDPDGAPIYPGTAKQLDRCRARRGCLAQGAYLTRCVSTWPPRWLEPVALSWIELGEGIGGRGPHDCCRALRSGVTSSWRARRRRPATMCPSLSTMRLQGVTEVVRGQDLYHATGVHRLLQELLGLPSPTYRHHRLILRSGRSAKSYPNRTSRPACACCARKVYPRPTFAAELTCCRFPA